MSRVTCSTSIRIKAKKLSKVLKAPVKAGYRQTAKGKGKERAGQSDSIRVGVSLYIIIIIVVLLQITFWDFLMYCVVVRLTINS